LYLSFQLVFIRVLHGEKFSHMPPSHTILRLDELHSIHKALFLLIFLPKRQALISKSDAEFKKPIRRYRRL
tara:strand:- start:8188 stop:8400 length:213 start_codon:yes stop_codon:yes gene_type:complete